MSWGLLNATMLVGLAGMALPVVIHLLNRRRDPIVDWGAMQFLDLGRRARQKLQLTELLLMLARMALLGAVALAMARPFLARSSASGLGALALGGSAPARDIVLVLDGSASMGRVSGPARSTPRAEALAWARSFVTQLTPADSVSVLVAGDRVRPLVDPPSFDKSRVVAALDTLTHVPPRGSSDLPAALVEAFRVLETARNPAREVIVLTDGQRVAWRPGEAARWSLVRDLQRRLAVPPRIWATSFGPDRPDPDDAPNGAVGEVTVSRSLITPGLPVDVTAEIHNGGPGNLTATAELLLDGRPAPGTAQPVGPLPAGGRASLRFRAAIASPGSHLLSVALRGGDDPLPADDEGSVAVEVAPALGVLLVDGEPAREPLTGETDFLRAALAPAGDDTPQVRTTVATPDRLSAGLLSNQQVLVLANVERLSPEAAALVGSFVDAGGGLLVAPGDRTDAEALRDSAWMPAALGPMVGTAADRRSIAHPNASSFSGPVLSAFGQGEAPPLQGASLFSYRKLTPAEGASVSARLDTGDPWVVERMHGKGRVVLLAGPLDAEGGTLPVNPDFVPLVHEWMLHLASGATAPRPTRVGEPLIFRWRPDPGNTNEPGSPRTPLTVNVTLPSGATRALTAARTGPDFEARLDDASESGVYRLTLPDPPGGSLFATIATDPREVDPARLEPAEAERLASGWPLTMGSDPGQLGAQILDTDARSPTARREVWRGLVFLALAGLCVEIYLTRKLVRGR